MENKPKGRDGHRHDQTEPADNKKETRSFLSLGHAFFNQYKADRQKDDEYKRVDSVWIRWGARAAITYTALTTVIMIVGIIQAAINWESTIAVQRPFVVQSELHIDKIADAVGRRTINLSVIWKNEGATTAQVAKGFLSKYHAGPGEVIGEFQDLPLNQREETFIGPHGTTTVGPLSLDASDALAIQRAERHIYVWGTMDYDDIFWWTNHHVTKFCIDVVGILGSLSDFSPDAPPPKIISFNCKVHNCTDDACNAKPK